MMIQTFACFVETILQVTEQSKLQKQDPALTASVSLAMGLGPYHFQEHDG